MRRRCSTALAVLALIGGLAAQSRSPAGDWRFYAGDSASTKYSPLDSITPDNVQRLQMAWRWSSPDNDVVRANPTARPGAYEDTPLMVNGVLYTVTSLGQVAAIDPATGRTKWHYDPASWKTGRPPNLGFTHRGVSYWTDGRAERLILGTGDAHLVSVDVKTGEPDMKFGRDGKVDTMEGLAYAVRATNYANNSEQVVVKDVIVLGSNISDGPTNKEMPRGDVRGYDVRTGKLLWTFHTIPTKGEFGYDTWEDGSAEYTGNTNVWSMLTADQDLGYVYLPLGTPTNDYYGGHRPGHNLFAESLVCLDAKTGKRVWHFQAVHHGVWDYDFPTAPILLTITVNGKPIKAVAQVSKQGFTYVFDRVTGAPVWPIEERPVPASRTPGEKTVATQPFPTKPPAFDRQGFTEDDVIDFTPELKAQALDIVRKYDMGALFTPPTERGMIQVPGHTGGANWGGAAADPETGMLFVPSITSPWMVKLTPQDPSKSNMRFRREGAGGLPTLDGLQVVKPPYSRVTAIDLNKGEIVWQVPFGDGPRNHPLLKGLNVGALGDDARGNPMVTKTLLFVSSGRPGLRGGEAPVSVGGRPLSKLPPEVPKIRAFDKTTGRILWEADLPGSAGGPMTYVHQGKQYIAMAVGLGDRAEIVAFALGDR